MPADLRSGGVLSRVVARVGTGLVAAVMAVLTAGVGLTVLGCQPDPGDAPYPIRPAGSLLAVGDTGTPPGWLPFLLDGQVAVGRAMQRAHRANPVDAVVLLGDNFYPDGLHADELDDRVLENVARPYCDFVEPTAELARRLGDDCPAPTRPIPRLLVVLGNHDLKTAGSVELERDGVPRLVGNWSLPAPDEPAVRELPGGLSLIFLDTEWPWGGDEVDALAAALVAAKGPWRVIVGHRPPITGHPKLSKMIRLAAIQAGVVVHLDLAGHVHGLVAVRGAENAPALTVVAGSGSEIDLQSAPEYRIDALDAVFARLGFVRLDAFEGGGATGEPAHLLVSLYAAPPSAALAKLGGLGTQALARYAIALDGAVRRIDGDGHGSGDGGYGDDGLADGGRVNDAGDGDGEAGARPAASDAR